ncbi:chemotaxis protein CheB [Mucilaginibacter aquariorum]|uniref:protein-glutamate methylesterase n=1 Tax=Mucilaginibacter aquariorum TaxID=2967225 RepID=A0ABT1T3V2_9SPHI|nr:chemotaxis protein CheB [Mucilaginibacter aquariorum]MCQ6959297.1 chemotaxis protein CheB [Mucilaginibacter aquariorum]
MKKKTLIALGASAGGTAALFDFFDHTLPDEVSYVITTHLYPHIKSMLTALIQKHAAIEVCEVEEDTEIMPDKVYVMPENKVMAIEGERLVLKPRDLDIKVNRAIDIFFKSLADNRSFNIIAIVLSGLGKDGTKGIAAISKNGGVIIAQEPSSAKEESMPESVIDSGYADFVLNPKKMPEQVIKIVQSFNSKQLLTS